MMKALDIFCGAGGATKGLQRAGFHVTGVDIKPQSNYCGDVFLQGDAMACLRGMMSAGYRFDLIWASPPCQAFTTARVIHGHDHPDLLTPTRDLLELARTPWIIENVPGAPMRKDVILCGSMFGEPRLKRHRWFELSWQPLALVPQCQHGDQIVSVFGHGGHVYHGVQEWREVMDINWMTRDELAQAIPPAYSEFLARAFLQSQETDTESIKENRDEQSER